MPLLPMADAVERRGDRRPPLRLPVGADAVARIRVKAEAALTDLDHACEQA
jgi:hypothetical protein